MSLENSRTSVAATSIIVVLFTPLSVQSQHVEPVGLAVDDLAWMAGRWAGESEGRGFEEHWSAPAHGQMTGMFRWIEGDSVRFTELLVIESGPAGPELLIRHFGPGLEPWEEEPVRFELAEVEQGRARFEAEEDDGLTYLTYSSSTPDSLAAILEKPREDGTRRTEFRYHRTD